MELNQRKATLMKKLILFTLLAFGLIISGYTQTKLLSDEELENAKTYYSLKEALKDPLKIYKLDLSYQKLEKLPKEIENLNNLQRLSLWRNHLKALPREIGKLNNLQRLELGGNQLKALPKEIGNLKNLKKLYLRNNKLSEKEKEKVKKLLPKCEIKF